MTAGGHLAPKKPTDCHSDRSAKLGRANMACQRRATAKNPYQGFLERVALAWGAGRTAHKSNRVRPPAGTGPERASSMSHNARFGFVLEYVTDIEAAKRFYVDVLGLEVERFDPTFVQFENFALAGDEPMSGTRDREIYWIVDDADAAFGDLSRKAEVSVPLRQMPFGKVFAIKDPEGQPQYFVEFARDRPSRPAS